MSSSPLREPVLQATPELSKAGDVSYDLNEKRNEATNAQDDLQRSKKPNNDLVEQQDDKEVQYGVRLAQASTQLWGTRQLIILYVL